MTKLLRPSVLAAAAFLLILITQFPARWCRGLLPADVHCQQLDGSLWSGHCDGLAAGGASWGNADWRLHPLYLLRGRLDVDLDLVRAGATVRGNLAAGLGSLIEVRDLDVRGLRLEQLPLTSLPRLHGLVQARIGAVRWSGGRIEALAGQVQAQGLTDAQGERLGDYQLEFPADAAPGSDPTGVLRDIGGPLRVDGSLRLTREPGFELAGRVAARPEASPGLTDQIRYLGSPDADGMRPFSIAGTF